MCNGLIIKKSPAPAPPTVLQTLPNGAKVGVASSINYRRWVQVYKE